jgi:hypothetical protein
MMNVPFPVQNRHWYFDRVIEKWNMYIFFIWFDIILFQFDFTPKPTNNKANPIVYGGCPEI